MRDANGRATGITGVAGRNTLFNEAGFLDAPNGGKANLPMDVIVASQKVMLKDLAKAGLTASAGGCTWEELYRQFQREGTAMRSSSVRRRRPAEDVAPARRRR